MATIYVSNIPNSCQKEDLKAHFSQARHGGGPIDYILHPLGLKHGKALVAYENSAVLEEVLVKEHEVCGTKLKVSAIPIQMYLRVSALMNPVVTSGIFNLEEYAQHLRDNFGVKVTQSIDCVHVEGTLIQIQCVQQALEAKHRETSQYQRQQLGNIGQADTLMPTGSKSGPVTPTSRLEEPSTDQAKVKARGDDLLCGDDLLQQSMHAKDALHPMREEFMAPAGNLDNTSTKKSHYMDDDDQVEDIFASSWRHSQQRAPFANLHGATPQRQTAPRFAHDEDYQSLPGKQHHDRPRKDFDLGVGKNTDFEDDSLQTTSRSLYKRRSGPAALSTAHESSKVKPRNPKKTAKAMEVLTEALEHGVAGYIWKFFGLQLACVQSTLNVDFEMIRVDEFVHVKITLTEETTAAEGQKILDQAMAQLVSLYQTISQDVVSRRLVYGKVYFSQREADRTVASVKDAYETSVYFDTETHGEITITGVDTYASAAATWALKYLNNPRYATEKQYPKRYKDYYEDPSYYKEQEGAAAVPYSSYYDQPRGGYDPAGAAGTATARQQAYQPPYGYEEEPAHYQSRREADLPPGKKDFTGERFGTSEKLYSRVGNKVTPKPSNSLPADDLVEDGPASFEGHEGHHIPAVAAPPRSMTYQDQAEFSALNFSIGHYPRLNVSVYAGDLTKEKVDAIVNPANNNLNLIGGLSYSILQAAHEDLQEECTKYVSLHGPLKVSEVMSTAAGGQLQCKSIIHVVGPIWFGNEEKSKRDIKKAIMNCLTLANNKLESHSIGLPAVSTGIYGVPEDICARGMFEAIENFSTDTSIGRVLEHIHVVMPEPDMFQVIFKQLLATTMACSDSEASEVRTLTEDAASEGKKGTAADNVQQKKKKKAPFIHEEDEDGGIALPNGESSGSKSHRKTKVTGTSQSKPSSFTSGHLPFIRDPTPALAQKTTRFSTASRISSSATKSPKWQASQEVKKKSQTDLLDTGKHTRIRANRECQSLDPALLSQTTSSMSVSTYRERNRSDEGERATWKDNSDCCPICQEVIIDAKELPKCGHVFCRKCIDDCFEVHGRRKCPVCGLVYGVLKGDQPEGGFMNPVVNQSCRLPGYEDVPAYEITYSFPSGIQKSHHPNPGARYPPKTMTAYLPVNQEGREVLKLLQKAFNAGLMFTIGDSLTTGRKGVIVFNDIHIKTSVDGGPTKYGYPDPTYLKRVKEELAAKGITP